MFRTFFLSPFAPAPRAPRGAPTRPLRTAAALLLLAGAVHAPLSATPPDPERPPRGGAAPAAGAESACEPRFPLSTRGRYIVDRCGNRFKLKSFNWAGASDQREVVGGLDHQSLPTLVAALKKGGFNSVRLPFSNDMLHREGSAEARCRTELKVTCIDARKNPGLVGRTALQVFDSVVAELTRQGIAVILNNHTTNSMWCCGWDGNGFWDSQQSLERWRNDWLAMAERYRLNPAVVGADLRNEVRPHGLASPNWGWGDSHDWHLAAQTMGNLLLARSPELLIVVEAVNWWGLLDGLGERPGLRPARNRPVLLTRGDKLVYAAHNYGYTGPRCVLCVGGGTYAWLGRALADTLENEWGFVLRPRQMVTAPVWLSEFGASYDETDTSMSAWLGHLVDYMIERDVDWAYWAVNALKLDNGPAGQEEKYGLFVYPGWDSLRVDWRSEPLGRLMRAEGKTGPVAKDHFYGLDLPSGPTGDRNALGDDWHPGYRKLSCPGGQRVTGVSQSTAVLCTNAEARPSLDGWTGRQTVSAEAHPLVYNDWAPRSIKLECPLDSYVVGVSYGTAGIAGILCARNTGGTGFANRGALDFWSKDNRSSSSGGDWRPREYKGQCRDDQYVVGVAYATHGLLRYGSALMCAG